MLNVTFINNDISASQAVAVLIDEKLRLETSALQLDQHNGGLIAKTISNPLLFSGKFGQIKVISSASSDGQIKYLILVGTGDEQKIKSSCIEKLGGKILSKATKLQARTVGVKVSKMGKFNESEVASLLASGAALASYRFDKYFTKKKLEEQFTVDSFDVATSSETEAEKLFEIKKSEILGVFFARDCVTEPPNILFPESYATRIIDALEPLDVDVDVLGEREMKNLGMGALLGVGQGSSNESKLVVMKYMGGTKGKAPIALVGKGVTFDTGGISLKPSLNMADMKHDMAGSAAVAGTIMALARKKAKVNVVGVIGLVENMPGGGAQRPSDVVTTMSGQTAEVLDTDAEGRLVLADAIWYAQDKFKPAIVIDLATLTGAIVVALGSTFAGCFANNDELADKLCKAGDKVDEKLWRMPLHKDFDDMIKSEIADMANIGSVRGAAGSSTAAHFIGRFVKDGTPWAHLDIAGTAWDKKGSTLCTKGATGYGVRLLNQFIHDYYEEK